MKWLRNMNKTLVFTPPRTGRNLLHIGFLYCTKVSLQTNNSEPNLNLSPYNLVFSIARDPKDSVASLSTMIKEKPDVSLMQDIQSATNHYNSFMETIKNNDVVIYKYDDLVNKTKIVFYDVAKRMNVDIEKEYDSNNILEKVMEFDNNNPFGYKKSFVGSPRYLEVMKNIDEIDFTMSYSLYNDAISRSVKL